MIQKHVIVVSFKRGQESPIEYGIGIGNGTGDLDIIIDSNMKVVDAPVWDYDHRSDLTTVVYNIPNV